MQISGNLRYQHQIPAGPGVALAHRVVSRMERIYGNALRRWECPGHWNLRFEKVGSISVFKNASGHRWVAHRVYFGLPFLGEAFLFYLSEVHYLGIGSRGAFSPAISLISPLLGWVVRCHREPFCLDVSASQWVWSYIFLLYAWIYTICVVKFRNF